MRDSLSTLKNSVCYCLVEQRRGEAVHTLDKVEDTNAIRVVTLRRAWISGGGALQILHRQHCLGT